MTKDEYNSFNIYTLREKGREMGVKSPTILKKAELIEQIVAIESGLAKPEHNKVRGKGRPPLDGGKSLKDKEEAHFLQEILYKVNNIEYVLQRIINIENILSEIIDYMTYARF